MSHKYRSSRPPMPEPTVEYSWALSQRIKEGLARARKIGRYPGIKKTWTEDQMRNAIELHFQGFSYRAIQHATGIQRSTVCRYFNKTKNFEIWKRDREIRKTASIARQLIKHGGITNGD